MQARGNSTILILHKTCGGDVVKENKNKFFLIITIEGKPYGYWLTSGNV